MKKINGIPYGTDDLYVQNMLTSDPTIETYFKQLNNDQLIKYHDRLVDTYDDDCFQASYELNKVTCRGGSRLRCDQWAKLIRDHIHSITTTN